MCDHLSFTLGRAGYRIHKIVPYGPVHETLQYLIRHASLAFAELCHYSYCCQYRYAPLGCDEWAACAVRPLVAVSSGKEIHVYALHRDIKHALKVTPA